MRAFPRATSLGVLAFLGVLSAQPLLTAQEQTAVVQPVLSVEEMETFLLTAKIVQTRGVNKGINNTSRVTLSDGKTTHDAHVQTVDIAKALFQGDRGASEVNFKDSYRYNIAGYRLARLLGLKNVPMSVKRRVQGNDAAVTWWVDDVAMDDVVRFKKGAPKEWNASQTASQIHIMRVFDELISNQDRNGGNVLWTTPGKMWLIDHTRAFRLTPTLKNPKLLERCETRLLEAVRGLTLESITTAVGDSLWKSESEAILKRRDEIVKLFEAKIKERGARLVLYAFNEP